MFILLSSRVRSWPGFNNKNLIRTDYSQQRNALTTRPNNFWNCMLTFVWFTQFHKIFSMIRICQSVSEWKVKYIIHFEATKAPKNFILLHEFLGPIVAILDTNHKGRRQDHGEPACCKGPSIKDVSNMEGVRAKFHWNSPTDKSKKNANLGKEGVKKSEKHADVFYGWSPRTDATNFVAVLVLPFAKVNFCLDDFTFKQLRTFLQDYCALTYEV